MRLIFVLAFLATPASAWEFTPGAICVLTHGEKGAWMRLTYDPTGPLYSITVTRTAPWQVGATFSMRFDGAYPLTITTDQQKISTDGTALTVTDTGFGNVLDGLQFNRSATAILGTDAVIFSLAGAFDPVAAFRVCAEAGLA